MPHSAVWAAIAVLLLGSTHVSAQDTTPTQESDWKPLTDDYSRQQLFNTDVISASPEVNDTNANPGSLAIPSVWVFPRDVFYDTIEGHPRTDVVCGIDLSRYNTGSFDFKLFKDQGISFVVLKATQGSGYKDPFFGERWAELKAADPKVRRGAYHFISSQAPGAQQADAFVNYVTLHGGWGDADLSPIVDLEWDRTSDNPDRWRDRGTDYILGIVLPLLKRIEERTGRKPVIYTATSWFDQHTLPLSQVSALREYPIWIADYNPQRKIKEQPKVLPNATNVLWQFTDRAVIGQGHRGAVDASVYYGSEKSFLQAFGVK